MAGMYLIGLFGRYGGHNVLPDTPWDLIVVVAFSLAIFYWAANMSMDPDHVHNAVKSDERQLEQDKDLNVPG
jgi:hypothetical protein